MATYVDPAFDWPGHRGLRLWCQLGTDDRTPEGLERLHALAESIGMRREWFQDQPGRPHYDLTPEIRAFAVVRGAVEVGRRDFIRKCCDDRRRIDARAG